jgi:hypothetical protein
MGGIVVIWAAIRGEIDFAGYVWYYVWAGIRPVKSVRS